MRSDPAALVAYDAGGASTWKRGRGVPIPPRLFVEALLFCQAESALIEPTLREFAAALWPNGWERNKHLPMLSRSLAEVSNYEIPWRDGLWRPVVARWRPFASADLDTPVPFDVRLPYGAGPGARVHRPTLRALGVLSAPVWRLYLSLCAYWDRRGYQDGGWNVRLVPEVKRDRDGLILDADGQPLRRACGAPMTRWNDPLAVRTGQRIEPDRRPATLSAEDYGNSTIGARSDLENVPIERLQAFYRKCYQPDNAILVVAGRFEVDRALGLVAEKFGAIPRPDSTGANKLFETYTAEPAQDGERTVTLRRVGDTQLAMAVYHVPPGAHEQYAAVEVLTHILGVEPAGRLYKNLVEPGLAASVFASSFQLNEPGVLTASVMVREGDSLEEAADALFATLDEIAAEAPTEEEVERAKTDYLSRIELSFNNPQGIALQLSEWASMGDWRLFFLHRHRLEKVTAEGVHEVAQTYLRDSNRTVGYFYPTDETPERAEIPETPDIAATVEEARDFWASFYGAEGGTIAVVGDFDADEVAGAPSIQNRHWVRRRPRRPSGKTRRVAATVFRASSNGRRFAAL